MARRDKEIVSYTMSRIRSKDTGIEMKLRKVIRELGVPYYVCSKKAFGHPDILIEKYKIAIFADSEFWHGYGFDPNNSNIKTNLAYWIPKIKRNKERDEEVNAELTKNGYLVLRYWGFEINKELDRVKNEIKEAVARRKEVFDVPLDIKGRTTLAYIEKDGQVLLLYRNKKKNDPNGGKYIGVGGHIEEGESISACLKREIKEETGLTVEKYSYLGKIDFINPNYPHERMYLFRVTSFKGELADCDEGELCWVDKSKIMDLPMWEGDRVFLPLLSEDKPPFEMTLLYSNDRLESFIGPKYKKERKHGNKRKHR